MKAYELQQLADFGYSKADIEKIEAEEDAKRDEARHMADDDYDGGDDDLSE